MAARKKANQSVQFCEVSKSQVIPRIGYIPKGETYTDRGGDVNGPYDGAHWFYEDTDTCVYVDECLKTLLDEYVPDDVQDNDLLLKLADTYRKATGK